MVIRLSLQVWVSSKINVTPPPTFVREDGHPPNSEIHVATDESINLNRISIKNYKYNRKLELRLV